MTATAYDFTRFMDRRTAGSVKWDLMVAAKPDVAAGILPMSTADMEFRNSPAIIDGLKTYLDSYVFGYTSPTPAYYDSLLKWNKERRGVETKQEEIVHTPGVVNALYHAVRAFTEPGDHVLIMRPVYHPFTMVIEKQGRVVENCPLKIENGRYHIDFVHLEELAKREENKLMIFCSPHNPVGRVWTEEELLKVADICVANNVFLVSDEIHCDIIMSGHHHHSLLSLDHPIREQLMVCMAPSKTFNLAAAGISTSFVPNPAKRAQINASLSDSFTHISNGLGYKLSELGYGQSGDWLDACLKVIEHNRDLCIHFFQDDPEVKVYSMEGTYLLWLDFNGLGLSKEELARFMTQEAQIFGNDGEVFGEEGIGFRRWNLAIPTAALEATLQRYKKARAALSTR